MAYSDEERLLRELELRLLQPSCRRDSAQLAGLLDPEFLEIGASGRSYGRDDVLARVPQEVSLSRTLSEFRVRWLTPDLALVNYRLHRDGDAARGPQHSLRSSLWRRAAGGWLMLFHQGTVACTPEDSA